MALTGTARATSNMDELSNDPQVEPSELYDQLMDFCELGPCRSVDIGV